MGQVLAYISLMPIAILVGFVTLIVFKRELHTVRPVLSVNKGFAFKKKKNQSSIEVCLLPCPYKVVLDQILIFFKHISDFLLWRDHLERRRELGSQTHSERATPLCR